MDSRERDGGGGGGGGDGGGGGIDGDGGGGDGGGDGDDGGGGGGDVVIMKASLKLKKKIKKALVTARTATMITMMMVWVIR